MIDYARISVKAGKGGDGGSSQQRIMGKRYSKADGGNGGGGGNVFLQASNHINTLEKYRYVKDYQAQDGKIGLGNLARGATGDDLYLQVPIGTVATITQASQSAQEPQPHTSRRQEYTGSDSSQNSTLMTIDLIQDGQAVLIARGGQGGRGNAHMKDEFGRRPRKGQKGQEGEMVSLVLELKIIAQVGLIGLPNAGKSTLLSTLTAAKPEIAAYPFTTLEPNLGVLKVHSRKSKVDRLEEEEKLSTLTFNSRLIIADIPGLIEGASQGKGLGHLFLRHIERTKLLVHLIDVTVIASSATGGSEAISTQDQIASSSSLPSSGQATPRNDLDVIWNAYNTVRNELKAHSKTLATKKEIIVLNKIDAASKDQVSAALEVFKSHRKSAFPVSAATGEGLDKLIKEIVKKVESQ